jgi:hypothetical protein
MSREEKGEGREEQIKCSLAKQKWRNIYPNTVLKSNIADFEGGEEHGRVLT